MANSSNLVFCLENSNHKTELMDTFDDYLRNESMVDVMLSCEGNIIKAHKMVLSAGSDYFRNIFEAFKNPFQFPVIILKDMPFRDLKAIIEFLYRGEMVVPIEQVSSLSKSAETLFIKGLEKYFNKSSFVSSGPNNSDNNSKTNNNSIDKSVGITKPKVKPTVNESKRSIAMNLRNTRRPDYRQLSNGDINSDEDMSVNEFNFVKIEKTNDKKSNRKSNSHKVSHQIKSELLNQREVSTSNRWKSMFKSQEEVEDNDSLIFDDNESDNEISNQNIQLKHHSSDEYMKIHSDVPKPSTSRQSKSVSQNINISQPLNSESTSINGGFNHLSSNDTDLRQIKGDSEKMSLIRCQLCPRIFSQTSSLNIHMKRIHSDQSKEHICHLCPKKYLWRSSLLNHMRSHKNQLQNH